MVVGGPGGWNDHAAGMSDRDVVGTTGTAGNDVIIAATGNNTINGLGGNDVICTGPGNDTIVTGNGKDKSHLR